MNAQIKLILGVLVSVVLQAAPLVKNGPVFVELFTSEGCSSCPPADTLLAELDRSAAGEVIVLGEHVDYWDRLGWKDPFSAATFTRRQEDYAKRFGLTSVYTPQMVVDGSQELVGSDRSKAIKTLADAARNSKVPVMIRISHARQSQAQLEVNVAALVKAGPAEVILAVTEGPLQTHVTKGENAGRVLNHVAVVRTWKELGLIKESGAPFHEMPLVNLDPSWDPQHLRMVVFVQDTGTGKILGAASTALRP